MSSEMGCSTTMLPEDRLFPIASNLRCTGKHGGLSLVGGPWTLSPGWPANGHGLSPGKLDGILSPVTVKRWWIVPTPGLGTLVCPLTCGDKLITACLNSRPNGKSRGLAHGFVPSPPKNRGQNGILTGDKLKKNDEMWGQTQFRGKSVGTN